MRAKVLTFVALIFPLNCYAQAEKDSIEKAKQDEAALASVCHQYAGWTPDTRGHQRAKARNRGRDRKETEKKSGGETEDCLEVLVTATFIGMAVYCHSEPVEEEEFVAFGRRLDQEYQMCKAHQLPSVDTTK